jgi:hypothetical protein
MYGDPGWYLDEVNEVMRTAGRAEFGWGVAVDLVAHIRELEEQAKRTRAEVLAEVAPLFDVVVAEAIEAEWQRVSRLDISRDCRERAEVSLLRVRNALGLVAPR